MVKKRQKMDKPIQSKELKRFLYTIHRWQINRKKATRENERVIERDKGICSELVRRSLIASVHLSQVPRNKVTTNATS